MSEEISCNHQKMAVKDESDAKTQDIDPYFYTKREAFTSEIYKIEITGLPIRFGYGQLKKLLNKTLRLNSHKIKGPGNNGKYAFVTFRCEADREKAMETLQGYKWKGKVLSVKKANPAADPLIKKRILEENDSDQAAKRSKVADDNLTETEKVKLAIQPLWQLSYEEQLQKKYNEMKDVLVSYGRKIQSVSGQVPAWLQNHREKFQLPCELKRILSSPVTKLYRNKCEFNIGYASDGITRTVGFRLSRYSAGSMTVAECKECDIIPESMSKVAQCFQEYIRASDKVPFNPENHSGFWRQLTVRVSRNDNILIIVVMHPQNLNENELSLVKEDLTNYFQSGSGKNCGVTSMYYQSLASRSSDAPVLDHLFGDKWIYENLCDLKVRISPDAFFQVNTAAAEILYGQIKDLIGSKENTVILDVCCGTGTIGLTLAKHTSRVIGIEMIHSAISDAKINAELNDLKNIEFVCGKAEDVILSTLASVEEGSEIIAIVDPPRAGLHNRVIRTLRSCHKIKSLIYVSCSPKSAMLNFQDLTRPVSNQYHGEPFIPMLAVPVDLFPHTNHCELLILFQRS